MTWRAQLSVRKRLGPQVDLPVPVEFDDSSDLSKPLVQRFTRALRLGPR